MSPGSKLSVPGAAAAAPGRLPSTSVGEVVKTDMLILLRWVLIVATSYLVIFSRPLGQTTPAAALFVAGYLASNIALTAWTRHMHSSRVLDWAIVFLDTAAVSVALLLTGSASTEFFILYFVVLFLSALTERIGLIAGAVVLISVVHVYTMAQYVTLQVLINEGYMLRIPFLFAVAIFFGNLVQGARARERTVEESRARQQRMEFLSTVSHDLKNPLHVIRSLAELLLDGDAEPLNGQQTDLARRIHESASQLINLSVDLIDAERIEAGRLLLQPAAHRLESIVENALVMARSASELKRISLEYHPDLGLPPAYVDPVHTERVVSNLLGNAIKFTPPGGRVRIGVERRRDLVAVVVSDSGPGISAEDLAHVFEKYHHRAGKRHADGSGLGLFIVKAVVEAHAGTVDVRSMPGRGTTVTASFPTVPAELASLRNRSAAPALVESTALAARS
jgi:signal transduction histidine kinase